MTEREAGYVCPVCGWSKQLTSVSLSPSFPDTIRCEARTRTSKCDGIARRVILGLT